MTAAIHGDEINGTGIIHDFLFNDRPELTCGTLVLVPVVNVFGFETHERYLPDRRDLNRSFPGSPVRESREPHCRRPHARARGVL